MRNVDAGVTSAAFHQRRDGRLMKQSAADENFTVFCFFYFHLRRISRIHNLHQEGKQDEICVWRPMWRSGSSGGTSPVVFLQRIRGVNIVHPL